MIKVSKVRDSADWEIQNPIKRMEYAIKYPKIESTVIHDKMLVTEKIDGSNIAVGYINDSLHIQSRNEILHAPYTFCGLEHIIKNLINIVEKMKDIMNCNFLVYGELFGHMPTITYSDDESKKIFGSENRFFRAFDLYDVDRKVFLKYTEAIKKFKQVGLPFLPILDIKYKNISELYNKVEKEKSAYSINDILEGFVLKADEECTRGTRKSFKVKREKFNAKGIFDKFKLQTYVNDMVFYSAYTKYPNDKEKIKKEMIEDTENEMIPLFKKNIEEEVEKFVEKKYKKLHEKLSKITI